MKTALLTRSLSVALLAWAGSTNAAAQCPADDAMEPNDSCATAIAGATGTMSSLAITDTSEDFFSYTVNPGDAITLTATFIDAVGDIDLQLFTDGGTCSAVGAFARSATDNEVAVWGNSTASPVTVTAQLMRFGGASCLNYDLTASFGPDPAQNPANDDAEEENDTCPAAVVPSSNALIGLFISTIDEDYYRYTLLPGERLDVIVNYENDDGDLDAQLLLASDCTSILQDADFDFTDDEILAYTNNTGVTQDIVLRVYVGENSARTWTTYNLISSIVLDPCNLGNEDSFEENDDCFTATPVSVGTMMDLFVFKLGVDEDWFSIDVPDQATVTFSALFLTDDGDIELDLYDACASTTVDAGATGTDNEQVTWTNTTGSTVNVKCAVYVWAGDPTEDCNSYDLVVDVSGGGPGGNVTPYCFGDGSGTPCPCGNNSSAGHMGGCANSSGNGGVLTASGNPSVLMDTLNMDLSSASQNSFALLVSGNNQLPQTGSCIGCGLIAFDGLRCAGGGFLRHGSRATDSAGETGNGWGPPGGPPGGLIAANGFTAGQTRNFFAFYRADPMTVCMTGQNSSNGLSVLFQP